MPKTRWRVEVIGNEIRVTHYGDGVNYGFTPKQIDPYREKKSRKKPKAKKSGAVQAKKNFIDLVNNNFSVMDKFVTLTFRGDGIHDRQIALDKFQKFRRNRLTRFLKEVAPRYLPLRYAGGMELHPEGHGWHFHIIFKLPYIDNTGTEGVWQTRLWQHGFVTVNAIKQVDNVGAYVGKYITKSLEDESLPDKNRYLCSQGLKRPVKFYGEDALRLMDRWGLDKEKPLHEVRYTSEWQGEISVKTFNRRSQRLRYKVKEPIDPPHRVTAFDLDPISTAQFFPDHYITNT